MKRKPYPTDLSCEQWKLLEAMLPPQFPLEQIFLTIEAQEALEESNQIPNEFLVRHKSGDWGTVGKEDWKENDFSVKEGFRILSAYRTSQDVRLWVITEADRSSTTLLLPEEY